MAFFEKAVQVGMWDNDNAVGIMINWAQMVDMKSRGILLKENKEIILDKKSSNQVDKFVEMIQEYVIFGEIQKRNDLMYSWTA